MGTELIERLPFKNSTVPKMDVNHDKVVTHELANLLEKVQEGSDKKGLDMKPFKFGSKNCVQMDSSQDSCKQKILKSNPARLSKQPLKTNRFVTKDGKFSVALQNIGKHRRRYIQDLFTTFLDSRWRWLLLLFSSSFLFSWLIFGSLWWLVMVLRKKYNSTAVCIDNVETWTAAFLFSVETQTTIGYGGRQVTPECPEGVVLLVFQTLVGVFINCSLLGLIFVKISRPRNRKDTVIFSSVATICSRDSKLCLMFRISDIRKRILYDCNLRGLLIHPKWSKEGEYLPYNVSDLKLTIDNLQQEYAIRVLPFIPLTMMHLIDEESPLYDISAKDLADGNYEVVIILEGTVPNTGMVTQALKSYTSDEIYWGHRFKLLFDKQSYIRGQWNVDLTDFDQTYDDGGKTPVCSASELEEKEEESESNGYQSGSHSSSSTSSFLNANLPCSPLCPNQKNGHANSHVVSIDSEYFSSIPALKETTA